MRNKILTCLLALACLSLCSNSRAAEIKIGIVDMRKVFDAYYKTVEANKAITNELADVKKSIDSMMADAEKTQDALAKANERKNDQSISAEERAKSATVADEKMSELQSMRTDIENFNQRENNRLSEKRRQRIETIVGEIRVDLNALAKKAGYTLVLDKSGETIPGVPTVIYTDGENDMTDALIKDLNAAAPSTPAADTKPAIPPPDSKLLPNSDGK
jgi:Skp family chaperone for outer membrane proteins